MPTIQPLDTMPASTASVMPRSLTMGDLRAALAAGWADFRASPTQLFFLCVLYPVAALIFGRAAMGGHLFPVLYPVASGFALLGPLASVGLYEISRRREHGQPAGWRHAFDVVREPGFVSVAILGLGLVLLFVVWVAVAQTIYHATLGTVPDDSMQDFATRLFGTPQGWEMIIAGNLVGLGFACAALAFSVFSLPMALDRAVLPGEAVRASFAAVHKNPIVMAVWGLIVAFLLLLGSIPVFIGLAVVLPILGHATWHLYRRAF